MKIIATITEFGAAANIGGEIERHSYIIDVPQEFIPVPVQLHIAKEQTWQTLSLSILKNEKEKS